jgi:hypothetical protein
VTGWLKKSSVKPRRLQMGFRARAEFRGRARNSMRGCAGIPMISPLGEACFDALPSLSAEPCFMNSAACCRGNASAHSSVSSQVRGGFCGSYVQPSKDKEHSRRDLRSLIERSFSTIVFVALVLQRVVVLGSREVWTGLARSQECSFPYP